MSSLAQNGSETRGYLYVQNPHLYPAIKRTKSRVRRPRKCDVPGETAPDAELVQTLDRPVRQKGNM
jgi:hypothetical protein